MIKGCNLVKIVTKVVCLTLTLSLALPGLALADPPRGGYRHLPRGYHTYHHGGRPYYYHGGHFYHYRGGYYQPWRPYCGFFIASLPFVAAAVVLGGVTYYTYNGVYYQQVPSGYLVVDPPAGAVVASAPVMAPPPVMAEPAPYAVDGIVAVAIPTLNAHSSPGAHYPVVAIVNQGQQMAVRGGSGGWINVQMPNGLWGWVAQKYTVAITLQPAG